MRPGPLVVAIDVGSSSVRASLYDATGRARRGSFARVPYAMDVDGRGSVSIPVERLLAAMLPTDRHGLTVLPFLAGERGPGYHADARGVVAGLSLATTPAELYLATIEAIALRFGALDRRLTDHLAEPPRVVASGGALARSALLPATLASALGRSIDHSVEGEASSRGAALQALAGVGLVGSPTAVPPPAARRIEPDPVRASAYAEAAERQERLYRLLLGEP